ncbi:RNase P modulator RnpM [Mesobacillus jeotgali]|uniref:RNase P modulator RnpM n=1 Tax=Mesobacillus jeotgali TaxID=129985 RepID=UPI0009A7BC16|nr:YlxR family protein [Mesobacillus jeotgali]
MNSHKKVPMRKCVATGEMRPKKELVRIVRSKEGEVSVDVTGKKSGRGAYLSKDKEAVDLAKKRNILSKQLETQVDNAIYDELYDLIEKESRQS